LLCRILHVAEYQPAGLEGAGSHLSEFLHIATILCILATILRPGLLRQRADALVLELAASYVVSRAEELTTVLDAMDSLAEVERTQRPPTG
jgi:hypothetical protein